MVGYDGSSCSRNALAYAAGVARRLSRPLLIVHVSSTGMYCEPLTGQVIALPEHGGDLEKWLRAELEQTADPTGLDVHVRTRRGSPARELAAIAAEQDADTLVIGAPSRSWRRQRLGTGLAGPARQLPGHRRALKTLCPDHVNRPGDQRVLLPEPNGSAA